MSVVDRWGVQVKPMVARRATTAEAERARDMTLCRLRRQGQSWRAIGTFLGLSYEGARKRWRAIPETVREHYGRAAVG
jgi:hypothetical protein